MHISIRWGFQSAALAAIGLLMWWSGPQSTAGSTAAPVPIPQFETPGLAELRKSGAIRLPTPQEVLAWNEGASRPYRTPLQPDFLFDVKFDYVITRAATLPFGLHGTYSKSFLVLAGVPPPEGEPGHSCVATLDRFKTNDETLCFHEHHAAMRALREEPQPDGPTACRLIQISANTQILGAGGYSPPEPRGWALTRSGPGEVAVTVTRPGSVVLVLSMYEPAQWTISVGPQSRITAVILAGYRSGRVDGLPPGTPVVMVDDESATRQTNLRPGCEDLPRIITTPNRTGPELLLFDHQIRAVLGRGLDGWQSADDVKSVMVR